MAQDLWKGQPIEALSKEQLIEALLQMDKLYRETLDLGIERIHTYQGMVTDKPLRYRDIYWCWILNEPMIISYQDIESDRRPFCEACKNLISFEDDSSLNLLEDDMGKHTFMFHIVKPGILPQGSSRESGMKQ